MSRNAAGSTLPLWTKAKNCLFLVKNGCFREAKFLRPLSGSELEQFAGEYRLKTAVHICNGAAAKLTLGFSGASDWCVAEADLEATQARDPVSGKTIGLQMDAGLGAADAANKADTLQDFG